MATSNPDLTGLRALVQAATPGPWGIAPFLGGVIGGTALTLPANGEQFAWFDEFAGPDGAEFDVPHGPNARLAALAPTLAQLVLDMGEALGRADRLLTVAIEDEEFVQCKDDCTTENCDVAAVREALKSLADLDATLRPAPGRAEEEVRHDGA